ncbi:lipoprotein [Streptomyces sulfonofaciens]|uniref:Lipoprotein n=1 Tax=Streptomyces sulfonofaciens TaxID=68272 RepID=A0A919L525_9ACTN|nr:DUF4097 family beta strand repeat-containing protein [Streptomyces sulfonofaciens]GHH84373.1 lipoprotein [Streptomyces sulfonofaciens]
MTVRVRRPRHRGLRVLVAACSALAVVSLAGGCGAGDDNDPDHRAFTLHGTALTIDTDNSALDVVPVKGKQVRVTRWFKGRIVLGGDPKVSWAWRDDRLTLRVRCSGVVAVCSAKHRVEVPRDAAVSILNQDGRVTAHGFHTALKIRNDDGSVQVDDCSGPLDLQSSDGRVRADGITAHRVRATTGNGSIRLGLTRVPDQVTTRSDNGSTTLTLPRTGPDGSTVGYQVSASTDNGGVDISVPRDDHSPHRISAHTKNGKVTVRSAN